MKKKFERYSAFDQITYEPYIVFRTTCKSLVYTLEQAQKDYCNNKRRPWKFLYPDMVDVDRSPDWGTSK